MSSGVADDPRHNTRQTEPRRYSPERLTALRHLQIVVQLAWLLPLLAFAVVAALLYRQAFDDAQRVLDHNSRVAQEQALKLFETNSMLLQRMLDLLGDASDDDVLARGQQLHLRLKAMVAGLPQVQGLFVNGSDARALVTSVIHPAPRGIDYSDREYFTFHRLGKDSAVFFTEQLRSRISGEPFFDMSLRRSRADGTFAGTVHVSLKPSYLTDFYAELARSDPTLRFSLFRSDGKLLARWPDSVPAGAQVQRSVVDAPAAGPVRVSQRGPSPIDGVDRMRVLRRLTPYPLWVVASVTVADVQSRWLAGVGWLALATLIVTLTLVWMARIALLRTQREFDAAQQLDDETELRQRMEVALLQSQKLEALGRLTGGVAHDFNNLLMVVNNNLFVHRNHHPDVRDSPQLSAIERAVLTGTKLTRQLLSFSRLQALVPERIDLKERMPLLVELLTPVLGKEIALDASADDGLVIKVDPAELELALINLGVNAKDAMPAGGRLSLIARAADAGEIGRPAPNQPFVVLEVVDTGSGIAHELVGRVFEPFFTTKTVGQGTGLGLSQVQALCVSAGGHARIESEPGRGTRVLLYFPAADSEETPATSAPPASIVRHLGCNLLLVEDNDAVARASRDLLESLGCTVEHVTTAEAALARLALHDARIDVILSDIEMPGALDGIALAERVAERHPNVPVVLMTGYAARMQQAVRRRFEVLPKPVAPTALIDAVAKALAKATSEKTRAA